MTQLSFTRSALRWIAVIDVATLLIAIGTWGERSALFSHGKGNIAANLQLCLFAPGYIFAVILAALFLPGGGHSAEELFWLGAPVSWIFYFVVGAVIFCVKWKE